MFASKSSRIALRELRLERLIVSLSSSVRLSLTGRIASASAETSLIHFLASAPRCEFAAYELRFPPVDAKEQDTQLIAG